MSIPLALLAIQIRRRVLRNNGNDEYQGDCFLIITHGHVETNERDRKKHTVTRVDRQSPLKTVSRVAGERVHEHVSPLSFARDHRLPPFSRFCQTISETGSVGGTLHWMISIAHENINFSPEHPTSGLAPQRSLPISLPQEKAPRRFPYRPFVSLVSIRTTATLAVGGVQTARRVRLPLSEG